MESTYRKRAEYAANRFYNKPEVSEKNKEIVKKFMVAYTRGDATISIFYGNVVYPLEEFKDIEGDFKDRERLGIGMRRLYDRFSPSTYIKIVQLSKTLAKFMYGKHNLPEAFDYIPRLGKKERIRLKRASRSDYELWNWEEGEQLIKSSTDIQIRAFVMTQLDAGLRPNECFSMNYGDVRIEEGYISLRVTAENSKTSEARIVPVFKGASYLSQWLSNHPTKKANDPLWVSGRGMIERKIERYTDNTAKMLLLRLKNKAGFKKKLSMYGLRHSAVALAKKSGISSDLASKKFGHSLKFFHEVYGKLTQEEELKLFKEEYSQLPQSREEQPLKCSICSSINEKGKVLCYNCNMPLTIGEALKRQEKYEEMEKQISRFSDYILRVSKELEKRGINV